MTPPGNRFLTHQQVADLVDAQDYGLAVLTPHELRHTAANLAVSNGVDVKVVQRMLGHASSGRDSSTCTATRSTTTWTPWLSDLTRLADP